MRGACPRHSPPIQFWTAIRPAIDDDPLSLMAELEGHRAGVRVVVKTARRRLSRVDHDKALEGVQPVETSVRGMRGGTSFGLRSRQYEIDQDTVLFERVVEQGEPAIAVSEEAQYRRHPLDG